MTMPELMRRRDEFWDTAPVYEGRAEIWQALRLACESDDSQLASAILESVGVSVPTARIADGAYDELGACYTIPPYCLCAPVNLAVESELEAADSSYARRLQEEAAGDSSGRLPSQGVEEPLVGIGTHTSPRTLPTDGFGGISVGARTSVDSGQSIGIHTAVMNVLPSQTLATNTPYPLAHGSAAGMSPSLYAVGSTVKCTGISVQSPKSIADSDVASFASSSMPLHSPQAPLPEGPLRPLKVRLCTGADAQVSIAADATIAQIEQHLRETKVIPEGTNRVLFFYLGQLLVPTKAPLKDLHLPKQALIQAFFAQP
ncbi:hypothetical protein EV174_003183 [Coemansia sp. RSA 2320]|nr:hypothetical protein EV174_003183 [Coemansia sp. RSA 2320]